MRNERECQTRRMQASETNTIQVVLNGEPRSVPAGMSVAALLSWLDMDSSRVAVELNREIVRQTAWPTSQVNEGAQVEVVWFVGGGAR
jgi:thiamine biosynthesis protein ThiS